MRKILSLIFILVYTSVVAQETMVIPPIRDARVRITSSFSSGTLTNTTTQKEVNEAIDAYLVTGYSETDPIFSASTAAGITSTNTANWQAGYDWTQAFTWPATYTPTAHTQEWSTITGTPSTYTPSAHYQSWSTITDVPATYTPTTHTQAWTTITDVPTTYTPTAHTQSWNTISDVPATYTPTSHAHGNISNTGAIGSTANLPLITTTSGAITTGSFGSSANTFCQGNDSRLSDSRPASDVYSWAKAASKPSYNYTEVGAASSGHNHSGTYEPANANIQSHISSSHQTIINGTGFVKASGTSLSYDNSTYVSIADKLPIAGGACDSTALTTSFKLPLGYVSYGTTIDSLIFAATTTASGGTVSVTVKVHYGTDISATGTVIVTDGTAVTSKSTATKVGTLDNSTPAKGSMLWATFPTLTTKPKSIMITVIGHR